MLTETNPSHSDLPSLHDLYVELDRRRPSGNVHEIVDAILLHPEFQRKVTSACAAVLKELAMRDDLRDDLAQETLCIVAQLLADGKLKFREMEKGTFSGWLWNVILMAARRAWKRCRPIWLTNIEQKKVVLAEGAELQSVDCIPDRPFDWDELLLAVSRINDPTVRKAMRHWTHHLTLTQSARLLGLNVSKVRDLRQRGINDLRHSRRRDVEGR
jgi:DNA-directed RNA polymerase specialized sigma24 family protein